MSKFSKYGSEFPLSMESIYTHLNMPRYVSNYHNKWGTTLEFLYEKRKVKIGDYFYPRDNSWCINLETGESAYICNAYCDDDEKNARFVIVDEPYWATVKTCFYNEDMWHQFVNVKSLKTGKYYRTIF